MKVLFSRKCSRNCHLHCYSHLALEMETSMKFWDFKSSPPSAVYVRQWIVSALVQIMACRLFGVKPLSKPILGYCQLAPSGQTSVKIYSQFKTFQSRRCICKYQLRYDIHFVQGEMSLSLLITVARFARAMIRRVGNHRIVSKFRINITWKYNT